MIEVRTGTENRASGLPPRPVAGTRRVWFEHIGYNTGMPDKPGELRVHTMSALSTQSGPTLAGSLGG